MEKRWRRLGIASGATSEVHPRIHGICRDESAQENRIFEECPALVAIIAKGTPDLARSRHARSRMAAVAPGIDAAGAATVDAAPASGGRHQSRLIPANFNSHFRRHTLISRRASDCVSTRLVHHSLVWRDDRAGIPGGALDGHPPRPARKHLRRKNRRPRVLDHARRGGWRPHRLCDDLLGRIRPSAVFGNIHDPARRTGLLRQPYRAALAFIIYVRWKKLSGWKIADILAPSIALGNAIGRIGCLLNGCCYGRVCHLPWAIRFPNQSAAWQQHFQAGLVGKGDPSLPVHPTEIYDALLNFALYLGLAWLFRRKKFDGQVFATYLIGYAVFRSLVELFRGDYPATTSITA